jgi:hypothetical protein
MKAGLIYATLLIIGIGAMGCGAVPEPPLACTDDEIQWGDHGGFSFQYCEALGMECNEAVTLADECPGFVDELEGYIREVLLPMIVDRLSFLPSFIDVEELVATLFDQYVGVCGEVEFLDQVGTCQPLGSLEDPCTEDADCLGDLACVEGRCLVPPEEPECVIDEDCDPGLVCLEEVCLVPEDPGCLIDEDCDPGLVCEEGMCVEYKDGNCVEDEDCAGELVCVEEACTVPPPAD